MTDDKEEHARLTRPKPPEKSYVPGGMPTPIEYATIVKAAQAQGVRQQGAYGKPPKPRRRKKGEKGRVEQPASVMEYRAGFATKAMVERCWRRGWIGPDPDAFNVFRITEQGRAVEKLWREHADAKEAYRADKAAWEAQNAPKAPRKAKGGEAAHAA